MCSRAIHNSSHGVYRLNYVLNQQEQLTIFGDATTEKSLAHKMDKNHTDCATRDYGHLWVQASVRGWASA